MTFSKNCNKKVVAVTGASGHIGANLVHALTSQGKFVRILEYGHHLREKQSNVEVIKGDIRDLDALYKLFDGAEIAYHLATKIYLGSKRDIETEEVNILGTQNVIRACLAKKVKRLIHFSSIHALSPFPLNEVIDESRPLISDKKAPYYDLSKAAGELEIQKAIQSGLNAIILNPCGVIGPSDFEPSEMGKLIRKMSCKKFLLLCKGGFNWVDVRDVVAAAITAETQGKIGERYLLSGEWLSLSKILKIIQKQTGKTSFCCSLPASLASYIAVVIEACCRLTKSSSSFTVTAVRSLQHYRYVSNDKAKRELGFNARPIEETIIDTLAWLYRK